MILHANGIDLFYEQTGEGPPLVLVHGNSEDHHIFDGVAPKLAAHHTLYALDSRGHGQSQGVPQLHYADMAEDVAAFIGALGLQKPALVGFSDGGIVGLMLAIRHPGLPGALVACGANTRPGQCKPWFTALVKLGWRCTHDDKMRLMLQEPNITDRQLAAIATPTLVLAGTRDILPVRASAEIARAIPGATLRILPGETHDSYLKNQNKFAGIVLPFLRRAGRGTQAG